MMKIFNSDQIRSIDEYTIRHEPISSVDLMERAAGQLYIWITRKFDRSKRFLLFAGPGNNGGDCIALARMLSGSRYDVELYYVNFTETTSADWKHNRHRLETETNVPFFNLSDSDHLPVISTTDIVIDGIFGMGLTRQVKGLPAVVIRYLNHIGATIISIDIPSGLFADNNENNDYQSVIKAQYTLTFHLPKLSFMFSENAGYLGEWEVLPIGLNETVIRDTASDYTFLLRNDIFPLIKRRKKFDHKGNFGHGLLVSGSYGKIGASVLAAHAALRTGIGLLTCHVPACGNLIIQSSLPEAMLSMDKSEKFISEIAPADLFSAIGVGPGMGTEADSVKALAELLKVCRKPMVLDADALNILASDKEMLSHLSPGTILTPHPKEFERLAGKSENGYSRLCKQIEFSKKYSCIVILKGAYTSVAVPEGRVFFNSSGNPGMATAGSGDVLTGIILSLLSQGYTPENASVLGVFLHGTAGDIAAENSGYESIIASDIINCIGRAFNNIKGI